VVLTLDGQAIAEGFLILESVGDPGLFLPVQEAASFQMVDKTAYTKVRATVGTHHHFLLSWRYTSGSDGNVILLHRKTNWNGGYFQFERDE
jgi:hypothetical protein